MLATTNLAFHPGSSFEMEQINIGGNKQAMRIYTRGVIHSWGVTHTLGRNDRGARAPKMFVAINHTHQFHVIYFTSCLHNYCKIFVAINHTHQFHVIYFTSCLYIAQKQRL